MQLAQRLALVAVIATLVLISLGTFVRATGSGLGCPDWPTCHGGVLPPGEKHPIIEMSHRFVATAVGLLVIALALVCWRTFRHVPLISYLALASVPLVSIQGFLGAVTVWWELPPAIVATHLLTAFAFLGGLVVIAVAVHRDIQGPRPAHPASVVGAGRITLLTLGWLALVVWVGGYLPESGASAACEGWPLCNGGVLPASDDNEILHMLHRYISALLGVLILASAWRMWRARSDLSWATGAAASLVALYAAQVFVGALNVWYTFPDWLTISHTALASLVWTHLATVSSLVFVRARVPSTRASTATIRAIP